MSHGRHVQILGKTTFEKNETDIIIIYVSKSLNVIIYDTVSLKFNIYINKVIDNI